MEKLNSIERKILELSDEISQNKILLRVNNLLLARFILQLSQVRNDFNLPKRNTFFKFEILDGDNRGKKSWLSSLTGTKWYLHSNLNGNFVVIDFSDKDLNMCMAYQLF